MTNPPQPPSVPTEKTEATPYGFKDARYNALIDAAQEVESHWNDTTHLTNQHDQAKRSGRILREMAEVALTNGDPHAPPAPTTGGGAGLREKVDAPIRKVVFAHARWEGRIGGTFVSADPIHLTNKIVDALLPLLAPSPVTGGTPDLAKVRDVIGHHLMNRGDIGTGPSKAAAVSLTEVLAPYLASGTPTTAGDSRHDDRSEVAQHLNYMDGVIQTCQLNGGDGNRVNLPAVRETIVRLRQLLIKSDAAATSRRREEGK